MMEAARTSETSVDNHFTRQYNPEGSSELLDFICRTAVVNENMFSHQKTYGNSAFSIVVNSVYICERGTNQQAFVNVFNDHRNTHSSQII
jgi:hypothetical protein